MKTRKVKVLLSLMAVVLFAWALNSCSKSSDAAPAVVKTALSDSISVATALISSTTEGTEDGQYAVGSQVTLAIAIGEAESVVSTTANQSVVNSTAVALGAAMATYRAGKIVPVAVSALVGHWGFDEGTGTTAGDATANAFNGTFKAGPAQWGSVVPKWTADRKASSGKAIQFNNGASIEIPYNTKLNPATLTIAAWVRTDSIRAPNRFIGLQSWLGYKFELNSTNVPFATVQTTQGDYDRDDQAAIPANEWHHLAVTFVDGTETFYVDGISVHTWTDVPGTASSISGTPYNLVIGADFPVDKYSSDPNGTNFNTVGSPDYHVIPLAWGGHFSGAVDEVRIYNLALSASQVTTIYNREK